MKFAFANWKMAQGKSQIASFFDAPSTELRNENLTCALFPSYPHLADVQTRLKVRNLPWKLGAQDCSTEPRGAFTGEVSASMLQEEACTYVLIGHSERRQRGPETETTLAQKLSQALAAGLIPVFCIGETESQREKGETESVIRAQLQVVLGLQDRILLAYEPVWAIGTGRTPTLAEVESAHKLIWQLCPKLQGVLYGGSVKPENAGDLARVSGVSGFLIGGASLKRGDFEKIASSLL